MRQELDNTLQKSFVFNDFADAMAWMLRCSYAIEKMDHHPERKNVYNRVYVTLRTHDAGNIITEKDKQLAAVLDRYYSAYDTGATCELDDGSCAYCVRDNGSAKV
jgi:4a-hydroxytetrahydrobiopterin dehydratase